MKSLTKPASKSGSNNKIMSEEFDYKYIRDYLKVLTKYRIDEGIIVMNTETNKYEFALEWDLFGYTQDQIFEGLHNIDSYIK